DLGGETFFLAQQAQQQVLGPDVFVIQSLSFFSAIGQHALAFMAERQVDARGNLLPDCGMSFNLLANRFHCGVRTEEAVGQPFVFPQQAKQEVLGFDVGTAELASLVPREEDYPPSLLRVSLKHKSDAPYYLKIPRRVFRLRIIRSKTGYQT